MATNENNSDPDVTNESSSPDDSSNDLPEEQDGGLTAEEAANKPYDGTEVWSKNKYLLFTIFGLIALTVAGFTFFKNKDREEASDRSSRFLAASNESAGTVAINFAAGYAAGTTSAMVMDAETNAQFSTGDRVYNANKELVGIVTAVANTSITIGEGTLVALADDDILWKTRAEELFLSFARDYDESLGGVASFRAAAIEYRVKRYADSAKNFELAASKLSGDPLAGRALLGQAISLIKSGDSGESGIALLRKIADDDSLLPADRAEARFLLAVQALADEDENTFSSELKILATDVNASYFHGRLVELSKTRKLLASAQSLPDLNLERGRAFLEENKKRKEVVSLESGLQYEILKKGNGTSPLEDDEVEVHYHGTLLDGQVFDSSIERDEPAKFKANGVIKGWIEALQLMQIGDKWKLFIPSDLAYAENGNNSIGPNETLTFEVELLAITPRPEVPQVVDSNASDSNSSSGEAPLIIPGTEGNATVPAPAIEVNASAPKLPKQPVDGNGSE
jgi:FKBP-type peptidyl-prolyl cis-trans isomerase